jgi:hypothetical protein
VIIDWDLAGYYPLAWVRTKFAVCGALDVGRLSANGIKIDSVYKRQVKQKLGSMGFPEVTEAWKRLHETRYAEWVARPPWLQ